MEKNKNSILSMKPSNAIHLNEEKIGVTGTISEEDLQSRFEEIKQKLNNFLESVLNPSIYIRWRILEILCDGKPRRWKEIERKSGLYPRVLSDALKQLVKEGVLVRKVEKTFPPKSLYHCFYI